MPRFYYPQPLELNVLLSLQDTIAHHIQVLRLKEGEVITLFNGEGGEYAASIEHIEKKRVEVRLKTFSAREAEPAHGLALAQVLPEGSKMDWILEKAPCPSDIIWENLCMGTSLIGYLIILF
jgi:16S rRNA (uracil1498-N3)-methyltransferase